MSHDCPDRTETASVTADHLTEDSDRAAPAPAPAPRPVYDGPLPTVPQKAFQSGSTPTHLMHRFMVRGALCLFVFNQHKHEIPVSACVCARAYMCV